MKKHLFFIIVVAVWAIIFGGLIVSKEIILRNGQEVLLPVAPVDPRDMFRGDYMALRYVISTASRYNCDNCSKTGAGDTVYAKLTVRDDKIASLDYVSVKKPNGFFIQGKVLDNMGGNLSVKYGIESYFFPEGKQAEVTKLINSGACAKVFIDRYGQAVLRDIVGCRASFSAQAMWNANNPARSTSSTAKPAATTASSTNAYKNASSTANYYKNASTTPYMNATATAEMHKGFATSTGN